MTTSARGKNYTVPELKQVCISVLYISQDPITGNGQRSEKFWEKVRIHYSKFKPHGAEERGAKSLEGKWGDIKHDVSKFIGAYQQVEDLQISGTNLEDSMQKAHELYKQKHPKGKSFTYEACFHILKGKPRWSGSADEMPTGKKSRSSTSNRSTEQQTSIESPTNQEFDQSDSRQPSSDETAEIGGERDKKRPGGNKKAKEDLKRQKFDQDALKASIRAAENYEKAAAERNYCSQINTMMRLIMMPTASLSPGMRAFAEEFQLEEAQKLRAKIRSGAPPDPVLQNQDMEEDGNVNVATRPTSPVGNVATRPTSPVGNAATVGEFYTPAAVEGAEPSEYMYEPPRSNDPVYHFEGDVDPLDFRL